jgi:AcrR family transcriptional regulator
VRGWIPVPGTTKARLVDSALVAFASSDYADVGVHDLAASGNVTVGSLYHHFSSKSGLYAVVRTDIESRTLDRMAGAAAMRTPQQPIRAIDVALVGFDYLVSAGYQRLLAAPWPKDHEQPHGQDRVSAFFASMCDVKRAPVGLLLHAAWQSALAAVADGQDAPTMRRAFSLLDIASQDRVNPERAETRSSRRGGR